MQCGSERIDDRVLMSGPRADHNIRGKSSRSAIHDPLTAEEPAGRRSMLQRCLLAGLQPDHDATQINGHIAPLVRAINHVGIFWTSDPTL